VNEEKEDKILFCRECGEEFIFSTREQEFYALKGFEHEPARCSNCRAARKRTQPAGNRQFNPNYNQNPAYGNQNGGYTPRPAGGNFAYTGGYRQNNGGGGNYRPNNYGNSGGGYNNGNSYGNSGGGNYRPNNYGNGGGGNYNPNYRQNQMGGGQGNFRYTGGGGNSYGNSYGNGYPMQMERKRYPIVCMNCGIETEVPFEPRPGVPVFCKTCYNSQKPNQG
jgi:CxxC-x17-CxxC domain-containing protein